MAKGLSVFGFVFVVMVCFTGCQDIDPERDIVGFWKLDADATTAELKGTDGGVAKLLADSMKKCKMWIELTEDRSMTSETRMFNGHKYAKGTWTFKSKTKDTVTLEFYDDVTNQKNTQTYRFIDRNTIAVVQAVEEDNDLESEFAILTIVPILRRK